MASGEEISRKRKPSKSTQVEDDSDSDFVSTKKVKYDKEKNPTTQQNKDFSTTRYSFQQMLMNSNNKFAELLKNKQDTFQQNKISSKTPLKSKIASKESDSDNSSSERKKLKSSKDAMIDFSPVACSTQITDKTFDLGNNAQSAKKHKVKRKETVRSESSDSEENASKEVVKKVKVKRKETVSENSDSEENTNNKKVAKKTDYSDSESSDSRNRPGKTVIEAKRQKSDRDSSSDEANHNKTKKCKKNRNKSLDDDSSNSEEVQVKKVKHKSLGTRIQDKSDSSDSENEKRNKHTRKIKNAEASDSSSSVSENIIKRKSKSPKKLATSDVEDLHTNIPSNAIKQLRKFEKEHQLSIVEQEFDHLKAGILNKKLFLVQIPKTLDPKLLVGTKISLSENTRVPKKSRKYDCMPSNEIQKPTAVSLNTEIIHVINPAGSIRMQRHLKAKHIPDISATFDSHIELPSNLKERHPLFGADYADKINLESHIQQKLQAAIESLNKRKKKKKKKKHKNKEQEKDANVEEEEIFKFLSQPVSIKQEKNIKRQSIGDDFENFEAKIKKNKKREEEASTSGMNLQTQYDQPKKKHKHKHIKQEVETDAYEDAVFKNEYFEYSKKIKREETDTDSSKKKKKKKHYKEKPHAEDPFYQIDQMLLSKKLEML